MVRVESMKLREAQKRPESALVKVNHLPSALELSMKLLRKRGPAYSSSVSASTQAHSSTPVPPSFAPPHGLAPQLSASHRPKLNLKCNSLVFACCNICPSDRGKYLKFCSSKEDSVVLLWKLKDASRRDGWNGRRPSCSW